MKLNVKGGIVSLISAFILCGCARLVYLYPGEPLPRDQVAIILSQTDCIIDAIQEEGKSSRVAIGPAKNAIELQAGKYIIYVRYVHVESRWNSLEATKSMQSIPLRVVAEPNRLYFIYPSWPESGTWQPIIIDNATNKDFESIWKRYHSSASEAYLGKHFDR